MGALARIVVRPRAPAGQARAEAVADAPIGVSTEGDEDVSEVRDGQPLDAVPLHLVRGGPQGVARVA